MVVGLGLPGATEFVVIAVVGVLVLGVVLTTLAISRARRKREAGGLEQETRR